MYVRDQLGSVDLSKIKQGKIGVGGMTIDTKSPEQHIKERLAKAAPLKAAALAGDNAAWATLWIASYRPLPVRSVDSVQPVEGNPGGWPRVREHLEQMLREIQMARGVPTPGNTTQGQGSGAFPSFTAGGGGPMLGNLGSMPVIATLGFLALAFFLKKR